jgi:hypothetical protein
MVQYFHIALVAIVSFTASGGYAEQNPGNSLSDQRRIEESWLRLESDRKMYEAAQPKGSADQIRRRDMRLQQQRMRDRRNVLQEKQSARMARHKNRILQNTPGYATDHRRGTQRLKAERRLNQLRLQNRMQRYSWPRD